MTLWTLALRSLRFHARAHLGVLLGATVGAAVLIGALLVGDSVRGSLRDMALARLGKVEAAMSTGDRLFRAELAANLKAAPVLALPGTVNSADGSRRANRVNVLGVDESFWKLAEKAPSFATVPPDSVVLNQALADQLAAKPGDEVLLRINKVSALSQDVALTTRDGQSVALRLRVHAVVGNEQLGRFSLQANQVAPFNAFVRLTELQSKANATGRANTMPVLLELDPKVSHWGPERRIATLNQHTTVHWELADAQLDLRPLTNSPALELRTDRIFLDPPAVRSALAVDTNAQPILTYLATLLRAGTNATAYPMVTAAGAPLVPADLRDDEVVINQWLADQLQLKAGGELELSYFLPDSGAALTEATNRFRVRSVVPMQMPWADRTLMPDFPGIAKAERIGDWDAGFPMKHSKLVDDPYWKQWRGTPKAFVSLSAGRKMWGNRFGDTTAVRFPVGADVRRLTSTNQSETPHVVIYQRELEKSLLTALKPADFGLVFQPVREQALKASREGQDFGGLFIGFSFFLIIAACVLVSLLFQFGVEQRATEVGTLLALGFTPRQVRRLFLLEGAGLSLLGSLLGAAGGVWYARAMLHALSTVWRDAVGTSDLNFHAEPATLAGGIVGSVLVAVFTLWLALRKQARRPARELLAGGMECGEFSPLSAGDLSPSRAGEVSAGHNAQPLARAVTPVAIGMRSDIDGDKSPAESGDKSPHSKGRALLIGGVCLLAALVLVGWAWAKQDSAAAGIFFGAGALLLGAAMAFTSAFLAKLERSEAAANLTLTGLGIRNATRRRRRSLATVAMLACGSFLIVSIGAFRLDEHADATKRASGTGGFALLGESTLPVVQDLNSPSGREFFNLDAKAMSNVSVVPFRVRDGDDASCLNLNRAQKPRLLGVKPEVLAGRGAFKFAGMAKGLKKDGGWQLLKSARDGRVGPLSPAHSPAGGEGEEVAAIADEASILWALGKKLGDTLDFTDERGKLFKVRLVAALAGSVLQGNLIIAEDEFTARYPGEAGYRFYLMDAPPERAAEVSATLTKALRDAGLELTPTTRRLAQFNAVQNTYLGTFQVLGGLGLLLGSAGLGVVVLRNVLERRGELALLLAVGFRAKALRWLVLSEHAGLLLLGLGVGVVAAAVAVLPALRSGGGALPFGTLGVTLAGVLVSGLVFTLLATTWSLRGRLLDSLRNH
ncbi:MAG: ABC transporter permease [Verrucomicrobia bacterium]|nr:ABC transporter permease [Verrucomicrobiota bacterium]